MTILTLKSPETVDLNRESLDSDCKILIFRFKDLHTQISEIEFNILIVDAIKVAYIHAVTFCFIDLFSDRIQAVTVGKF